MIDIVTDAIRGLAARGLLPRDLQQRAMQSSTPIDELGIDSLGKLELLAELEEKADVALSEGMLAGLKTLGDLAQMIQQAKGDS